MPASINRYDPVILRNQGHRGRCSLFTRWTGCWSITGHTHHSLALFLQSRERLSDSVSGMWEETRETRTCKHHTERPELDSNLQPFACYMLRYCSLNISNTAVAQKDKNQNNHANEEVQQSYFQRRAFWSDLLICCVILLEVQSRWNVMETSSHLSAWPLPSVRRVFIISPLPNVWPSVEISTAEQRAESCG